MLNTAGAINAGTNPVDWTRLKSVPAGFADGVDADSGGDLTGITAGAGISVTSATGPVPTVAIASTALPYLGELDCGTFSSVTATSPTRVKTLNFTIPSTGRLIVTVDLTALVNCDSAAANTEEHCYPRAGLCTSANVDTTCGGTYSYIDSVDYNTTTSVNAYVRKSMSRVLSVTAGTTSLYINVTGQASGDGAVSGTDCQATAIFVPAANALGMSASTP